MNRTHIILHHTGAEEKDTGQIRRYHLSLGWRDIGYNYVIERDGRVVAGRSLSIPGAHCKAGGMNNLGIGVALIGNIYTAAAGGPEGWPGTLGLRARKFHECAGSSIYR